MQSQDLRYIIYTSLHRLIQISIPDFVSEEKKTRSISSYPPLLHRFKNHFNRYSFTALRDVCKFTLKSRETHRDDENGNASDEIRASAVSLKSKGESSRTRRCPSTFGRGSTQRETALARDESLFGLGGRRPPPRRDARRLSLSASRLGRLRTRRWRRVGASVNAR